MDGTTEYDDGEEVKKLKDVRIAFTSLRSPFMRIYSYAMYE